MKTHTDFPLRSEPMAPGPRLTIQPDALKRKRLAAVLSRQQLADLSGVSRRRIEQIEAGSAVSIKPETARALASALGCPVQELVKVVED